jgi:hypothetical protein
VDAPRRPGFRAIRLDDPIARVERIANWPGERSQRGQARLGGFGGRVFRILPESTDAVGGPLFRMSTTAFRPSVCPRRLDKERERLGEAELPDVMAVASSSWNSRSEHGKHLIQLSGVAAQDALHRHALTCAGRHDRLRGLRGKVHMDAADRRGAGGRTGCKAARVTP